VDAKLARLDHAFLYADKSSKDEQLLIKPVLCKTKLTNMEGS
jgi:hypothetical protein